MWRLHEQSLPPAENRRVLASVLSCLFSRLSAAALTTIVSPLRWADLCYSRQSLTCFLPKQLRSCFTLAPQPAQVNAGKSPNVRLRICITAVSPPLAAPLCPLVA